LKADIRVGIRYVKSARKSEPPRDIRRRKQIKGTRKTVERLKDTCWM
jgi:hypothetical protein